MPNVAKRRPNSFLRLASLCKAVTYCVTADASYTRCCFVNFVITDVETAVPVSTRIKALMFAAKQIVRRKM
jgi:hypothetical protein